MLVEVEVVLVIVRLVLVSVPVEELEMVELEEIEEVVELVDGEGTVTFFVTFCPSALVTSTVTEPGSV